MIESQYTQAVHKRLPKGVLRWKIMDPYMGGIPDAMYIGANGKSLWVEYKYIKALPKLDTTKIVPKLSELQRRMLVDLESRGQQVIVVIGFGRQGMILDSPREWNDGITKSEFCSRLMTYEELGRFIANTVGV